MALTPARTAVVQSQPPQEAENALLALAPSLTAWYQPGSATNPLVPAHAAFTAATHHFSTHLTRDECKRIWLADKPTMHDVVAAVESAKVEYEARSKGTKVRRWLVAFSDRVMYYGAIMDTLSQHHPEYVALAWGTMKFLFMGLLNHEELLKSIAKTLSRIADVLPRVELDVSLYGNPLILTAVANLYAHIIKFVQYAVRWYQKGKIAHGFASIMKPFQITGKEMVEQITQCSRTVDKLAMSANRAETRALHARIIELTRLATENRTLNMQISADIRDVRNGQLGQIATLPSIKRLPQAAQTLAFQIAMRNRDRARRTSSQGYRHLIPALQNWVSQTSRILLVEGRKDLKVPRYFATDVIEEVSKSPVPVIWAMSDGHLRSNDISLMDVLRTLTLQALLISRPSPTEQMLISPSEIEDTTTDGEWLVLLQRALRGFTQLFIVIDMAFVGTNAGARECQRAVGLLSKLFTDCQTIGLDLKIIVTARRSPIFDPNDEADEQHQPLKLLIDSTSQGRSQHRGGRLRTGREQLSRLRTSRGRPKLTGLTTGMLA